MRSSRMGAVLKELCCDLDPGAELEVVPGNVRDSGRLDFEIRPRKVNQLDIGNTQTLKNV
jgi:hypothetical protein